MSGERQPMLNQRRANMFERRRTLTRMPSRHGVILICITWLFLGHPLLTPAQEDKSPQRGFHPAGSYALSEMETISTVNGDVIFRIPLAALPPGRGAHPGANVNLIYNSKTWDTHLVSAPDANGNYIWQNALKASDDGGWRYGFQYEVTYHYRFDEYPDPTHTCQQAEATYAWKIKMTFPDGGSREFRPQGFTDVLGDGYFDIRPDGFKEQCPGPATPLVSGPMTYYSTDGSYLRLDFSHDGDSNYLNNPWTLSYGDGRRVTGGNSPLRLYDRNNNYVTIENVDNYNNHPATLITDQLGRSLVVEYDAALEKDYVRMQGFNDASLVWEVQWKTVVAYNFYYGTDSTANPALRLQDGLKVIDRIILPSQAGPLFYSFGYNTGGYNPDPSYISGGLGEVSSLTLPSGALASYQYSYDDTSYLPWHILLSNWVERKDLTYLQEYDGTSAQANETWLYSFLPESSQITSPDGGILRESFRSPSILSDWNRGLVCKSERTDGSFVERIWERNIPYGASQLGSITNNPHVKTEFLTVRSSAGTPVKTAIKDFSYDKNGNVTRISEYDWVDYGMVARDSFGKPTGIPAGASIKKVTINSYHNPTPEAADSSTDDPDVYHKATSPLLRNAIASAEIRSSSVESDALSRAEYVYDNPSTTGNLIQQTSWDSTKGALTRPLQPGNSVSISHQYSPSGNRTLTTDARGFQTQSIYDPINGHSDLYVTELRAALGTAEQRKTQYNYDFNVGLETLVKDLDNNITNLKAYDAFGRPTLLKEAVGAPDERWSETSYSDASRRVIARSDLSATGDLKLVQVQHFDPLGRLRLSRSLEDSATSEASDETTGIKVQTRYRYSGTKSYQLVSNPFRAGQSSQAGSESTMGWTLTTFDPGGRVTALQNFSGAALPAPWGSNAPTGTVSTAYDGEFTTVSDQAGKSRRSRVDGLGRLVRVDEPNGSGDLGTTSAPSQATSYGYDALGNLGSVTQAGQVRSFAYSSLSRLLSASNPESGLVTYQYDANGSLIQKTDARSVVKTFVPYDGLNRVKGWSYAGGPASAANTPAVTFNYDAAGISNPLGYPKGRRSVLRRPWPIMTSTTLWDG